MKKIIKTIWEHYGIQILGVLCIVLVIVILVVLDQPKKDESDSLEQAAVSNVASVEEYKEQVEAETRDFIQTLKDIEPFEISDFAEEDFQNYYTVYENSYVLHLRKALNGYLSGTNEGVDMPESTIKGYRDSDYKNGLASFPKDYYKSKFTVLYITDSIAGGKNIDIVFQDKPDKIFRAWVYRFHDEDNNNTPGYDLRAFSEAPMSPESEVIHLKQYRNFILDKEHSL